MTSIDDKAIVQDYFNTVGFDRWRRIYGEGEVNKVQRDIRVGHQQTVNTVLAWLEADGDLSGQSFCDAGCGVGSLSIPLAKLGVQVAASDLSTKMVEEAQARALESLGQDQNPTFMVQDLEQLTGHYDTVICLDVLIHYPDAKVAEMIAHLASLATSRLILSFAPWTLGYMLLKQIGNFFPGPSKATRAYLHREFDICDILRGQGWQIERRAMTKTSFYFSRLIEARRSQP
ncbi:MAG: magnesium protoporphyrin IX methyltransferase [Acaryochloridaceae cyanobacterium SU_2_1]|nr:magnesium protoporphyrin IX methyltransferase [Acaryochloridaceae cyanobacterium SU_2_1]